MKRIVSILLVAVMLITLGAITASAQTEEKEYTVDDNFKDNAVLIATSETKSYNDPILTPEDFDNLGVISVERKTYDGAPIHIYLLILDRNDKQNVIDTINQLKKIEWIIVAEPDFSVLREPNPEHLYETRFIEEYIKEYTPYEYKEVFHHYDDNGKSDWCLIYATADESAINSEAYLKFDDFVLWTCNIIRPFTMKYAVYDVEKDSFIDLIDNYDELSNYEGLMDVLSSLNDIIMIGDADIDGKITILDATAIQMDKANLKSLNDFYADRRGVHGRYSDYDKDGETTLLDATAIQMKLAGIEE
nr:hypothetical protein [Ruminococcus sp.]